MNTQTFFTLGEAARQVGKTKPALSAAIKAGRLSVHEKTATGYQIAAAELFRVYPPSNSESTHLLTPELNPVDLLQKQIEQLERERRDAVEQIADLRRRLDQSEQERRDTIRLLTHQAQAVAPSSAPKRGLLDMLRGWRGSGGTALSATLRESNSDNRPG